MLLLASYLEQNRRTPPASIQLMGGAVYALVGCPSLHVESCSVEGHHGHPTLLLLLCLLLLLGSAGAKLLDVVGLQT